MLKILSILIFSISCSGIQPISSQNKSEIKKKTIVIPEPLIKSEQKVVLQPGKVKFVKFDINLADGMHSLICNNKSIPFFVEKKQAHVFMAESYFSKLKPYKCQFQNTNVLDVTVKRFPYKSEKLNVDKKRVSLSKKDLARAIKEKQIVKKVYLNSASYFLFNQKFRKPLTSYITSYYGNKRLFNNKKRSQHLGNDLRAAVGVPIPVSNKGKVVFVGDLFFSGNVVIVDHGLNIYTMYGHLSKIKVTEGMIINQRDIIGLAGATGRVSGPHLHWGVKINGHWVDGFSLVEESEKMFHEK